MRQPGLRESKIARVSIPLEYLEGPPDLSQDLAPLNHLMVQLYDPPVLFKGVHNRKRRHIATTAKESKGNEELINPPLAPEAVQEGQEVHHEHKAAGWGELFCDLVFVSIIAELSHLLIASYGSGGLSHRRLSEVRVSAFTGDGPMDPLSLSLLAGH